MKPPRQPARQRRGLMDLLTLERLMTSSIVHLVYWMGLGLIALIGFAVIGAAVGGALREGAIVGWLLALPVFVAGLLVIAALAVLWRSFCELYVVIIGIGEDLRVLRRSVEAEGLPSAAAPVPARTTAGAPPQ